MIHDIVDQITTVIKDAKDDSHIVSTSDISNYFNLQVTTTLYFGS